MQAARTASAAIARLRFGAGMDDGDRPVLVDVLAETSNLAEPDRVIDGLAHTHASAAERDDSQTDGSGVDRLHVTHFGPG